MPFSSLEISPQPLIPLRRWLHNESLFSLCSRSHIFLGNSLPAQTSKRLFGHSRQGTQHDFPSNVSVLADRAGGTLGTAAEIVRRHTILPFFAPFQSPERIQAAEQTMLGPHLGSLKFQLGLITGRFGAQHPLRACPECMTEDIEAVGCTYWHLDHQYPGVLVCPRHGELLRESIYKRIWRGRFSWCLPAFQELTRYEDPGPSCRFRLQYIADACLRLADIGCKKQIDVAHLGQVYAKAIARNHSGADRRHSLPASAAQSFARFTKPLQAVHLFNRLPSNEQQAEAYLRYLLLPPRSPGHPLRHLTAITWMFESFDQFLEAYNSARDSMPPDEPQHSWSTASVTVQAAAPAPLTKHTLKPKFLKPPTRRQALQLLTRGLDKNLVCRRIGITISTVNKLLRAEPAVNEAWKAASARRACAHHRTLWCRCARKHPGDSPQQLRKLIPSVYAWIYRNDRAWLAEQTANLPSGRRGNHSRVDWDARDRNLEKLVRERIGTATEQPVDREQIYLLIPELRSCLRKKDRFPLTLQRLQSLLGGKREKYLL